MRRAKQILAVCLGVAVNLAASAQTATPASRGELLYTTHCVACHTTEVHWRQKKLATDWASLDRQVRRWAGNVGLAWTDGDIVEVTRFLNSAHYHFATPSVTGRGPGHFTPGIALAN